MEKNSGILKTTILSILFVLVIIGAVSVVSYSYFEIQMEGSTTETEIDSGRFNFESTLNSSEKISSNNMLLINSNEIDSKSEQISFGGSVTENTGSNPYFDVYLKDISISNNLIDSSFKWQLLQDGTVIKSGDFSDILSKGKKSTTRTDTSSTKYFDTYYIGEQIEITGTTTGILTVRVYLLNDLTKNQNSLMNGSFECKIGFEGYKK